MNKMLLVSEVATLGQCKPRAIVKADVLNMDLSIETSETPRMSQQSDRTSVRGSTFYKSLNDTQRQQILQQLDAWEEPVIAKKTHASYQSSLAYILVTFLVPNFFSNSFFILGRCFNQRDSPVQTSVVISGRPISILGRFWPCRKARVLHRVIPGCLRWPFASPRVWRNSSLQFNCRDFCE